MQGSIRISIFCYFIRALKAWYSIINMVKPGTFELDTMNGFETPGLSFVMSLPGPEQGLKASNVTLEGAKKLRITSMETCWMHHVVD